MWQTKLSVHPRWTPYHYWIYFGIIISGSFRVHLGDHYGDRIISVPVQMRQTKRFPRNSGKLLLSFTWPRHFRTSLNIWVRTEWQFDATYEHNVSAMSHFGWIKFDLNWRIDFTARVMTRWYIHSKFTVLKNKLNQEEIWEYKTKFHNNDHK